MAALAVCILLWLLSGLVFLLRGPAHHRRHPGAPTVSQTNIPRQCRGWRQTGSLFSLRTPLCDTIAPVKKDLKHSWLTYTGSNIVDLWLATDSLARRFGWLATRVSTTCFAAT
ncbi:hypothetical protein FOXG_15934 [Fusarium oxysporum f. sp. lycopersici 4287]|uniref:Secreted protein n=1 Tax=Fusarium oxysporum f. sp. lycopersici (strain 4287 / CBS 123668 / FGSC 9935 / NRRL 34936) TaxID=426428 RepID=A0A0J9W7C5_FUSO4|nr:hypothetical protein FOXG_15934 [Fusarium oxysporum f. sp. lycopersici 4287]KNB18531.1 hypothetical protein FOXG_15934 [Fusarium oxysporum f. sp. lycopersici 4287]